jgi:release factor glutamine methyltransferase
MLIQDIVKILTDAGIEQNEANIEVKLLIEHFAGYTLADIIMGKKLTDEMLAIVEEKAKLRAKTRHPIQYIIGQADFMGEKFNVQPDVLIPRDETELLVRQAIEIIKEKGFTQVLDMCTGSGCIAISVSLHGNVDVAAVDISEKALEVAKENAKNLGADRVKFIESDLFEKINVNNSVEQEQRYDIIVSNPPYIPSKVVDGLMPEVVEHEPRLALDGTEDGLLFYRKITEESLKYIKPDGWLCYEIGCEQGDDVSRIMMDNGYKDVKVIKDLAGLDRVVVAKITK